MPKDTLIEIAKRQLILSHSNLGLGLEESHSALLEHCARLNVFLCEQNLFQEFHEWLMNYAITLEIEKRSIKGEERNV